MSAAVSDTKIEILDGKEPSELRFLIASKRIGTSSEVESGLTITAARRFLARSLDRLTSKVLGGLLESGPHGLIRGAAQKIIADIWEQIAENLAQKPDHKS